MLSAGLFVGCVVFLLKTTLLSPESNLSGLVATIFSVLAGFLAVALNLIVVSQPTAFKSVLSRRRYLRLVGRRMRIHNWLFYCYVSILIFVFYSEMLLLKWPYAAHLLESLYLSLASASLIWSLGIPATIARLQVEHSEITARVRALDS